MKVVILEDELLVAKSLEKLLHEVSPAIEILARLESVEVALNWFEKHSPPDLIISDIQLSDGVSFDIFKKLNLHTPVIFTTAYNEYALRAFKLNSIDYLLKPIDKNELKEALEKFERNVKPSVYLLQNQITDLIDSLHDTERKYKTRFTANRHGHIVALHENELAYFLKEDIVFAITLQNQKLICDYASLDELEELVDPETFFRTDRQHLVHRNCIVSYKVLPNAKLELRLQHPIPASLQVSKERAHRFRQWFEGH